MSRTTRRQGGKQRYWWNDPESREWWDQTLAEYQAGDWKQLRHFINHDGSIVEYYRKWYHPEVTQYRDYEQYVAAFKHKYSRDRKGYGGGVPSSFVNMLERSLRAKHKRELERAKQKGEWDGVMLEPFIRDAGWLYW